MIHFNSNRHLLPRSVIGRFVNSGGIICPPPQSEKGYITAIPKIWGGHGRTIPPQFRQPCLAEVAQYCITYHWKWCELICNIMYCSMSIVRKSQKWGQRIYEIAISFLHQIQSIKIFPRLLWALLRTLKCVVILPPWYNFNDAGITWI